MSNKEQLREEFRDSFGAITVLGQSRFDEISDWWLLKLQAVEEEVIKECITLSDTIENQAGHTEFNEWRAFKGFRNNLQDKLSTFTTKTKNI